eukprot:TRINITY_DN4764_c1_g1_i3.p1 TRINITY_DN4764_c1_g1~~TRINITY_DN4764_c1_g1_i3.p1  ORF type:complete len:169 (-),score=45.96 TRINITY_DN4764_c1_g1_i3:473-979(-)
MFSLETSTAKNMAFEEIENLKNSANSFYAEGKYSQAVIGYSFAIKQVIQWLLPANVKLGDNPLAIAQQLKAAKKYGDEPLKLSSVLYCNRAQAYLKLSKFEKAAADAAAAAALDPCSFKAWYRKALAYGELREWYEASLALKEAVRLEPKHEEARAKLEEVQYRLGRQ